MKSMFGKIGLMLVFLGIAQIAFSQDTITQELKYFKSDNAFYLGNKRLLDSEIELTLSNNLSALDAWKKGNYFMKVNENLKIATGVCLGVGGGLGFAWPFFLFNEYAAIGCIIIGATLLSAGIVTGIMIPITKAKYKSYYSDAVDIYNKSNNTASLHIGTTGNGISFSLKF